MRGWAEGQFELSEESHGHLDQCIVCRACEGVCPSGIRMGEMVESFRAATGPDRPAASPSRWGRWLFREILPHRGRIAALSDLLELYQRSGLRDLVGRALPRVSARLTRLHSMQPDVPLRAARRIETDRRHAAFPAEGERRARVALFLGCVGSEWFAPVHRATIRVLTRNGCEVVVPHAQTCCGALHRHAGVLGDAAKLLAKNRSVFAEAGVDAVIVNAAGCGASLKEPLAGVEEGPPSYQDVCEFLGELDIHPPERALPAKVAYDQPCHLVHGQGIGGDVVERLLRLVPELELVPLAGSERCCGAGGVYNLRHPEMAEPILAEKTAAIRESGAEIVVTGNPGCAMQIAYGLRGTEIEVLHPVEILARAYSDRH
jgi:glycolate oxidase iron-sulfur subunit